jgi:bla regulator protein blaR1
MQLFFSLAIPVEAIIQALVWTLVHSIWLGILLSLLAAGIVYATNKTKASIRYNLLSAAMMVFIICIGISFYNQFKTVKQHLDVVQNISIIEISKNELTSSDIYSSYKFSFTEKISSFVTVNANWFASIWILIIAMLFVKLALGLYKVHCIKNQEITCVPEYWNNRVFELSKQLQINKTFQIFQSGIVKIPVVIDFLKPVILLPAAMLTSLTANEIEAILLHELAHIRRNDFIVNLLQSIVEIIFFFNPAVLWVSSLLKIERENCCDDIAIQHTETKQNYIQALVSFQQFNLQEDASLAMGLAGEKKYLLNRIKRIIYNKNKTLNNMEKKFLSASIILVSVCLFAFISIKAQDNKKEKVPILQPVHVSTAETPIVAANKQDINKEKETILQPVSINTKNTEMVSTVVVANDTPVYKVGGGLNLTGETNRSFDGKEYRVVVNNSVVTEMYIDGQKIPAEKIIDYKTILDKCYSNMIKQEQEYRRKQEQSMSEQKEAMGESEQVQRRSERAMRDGEQAMRDSEQSAKDRRTMNEIIDDLIANNIIKDRKEINSLKFNADELVVNDVKQPTALHKKFKNKYVTSSTWSWGIKQNK